ncbi:hypothetical protein F4805DRAFT_461262 [Annulohypoxylon moriforme]|nr:hypothetical protein F4805DRAFT_461262 [Annulohypoxylon moriforme]
MGNILGKAQVIYVTYGYANSPCSSSPQYYNYDDDYEYEYIGGDELYNSYDWGCCPWCGLYPVEQGSQWLNWEDAVIGVVRRKGCSMTTHIDKYGPLGTSFPIGHRRIPTTAVGERLPDPNSRTM